MDHGIIHRRRTYGERVEDGKRLVCFGRVEIDVSVGHSGENTFQKLLDIEQEVFE